MGVNQITEQMRTKYVDEFKYKFDRKESLLKRTVRSDGVMNGNEVVWDVIGVSDAAQQRTRDGKIPVSQLPMSAVRGTLAEHFKKYEIDSFDLFRANPNTRSAQQVNGIGSINQAVDQAIINELDGSSNALNGGSAVDFGVKSTFLTWTTALQNNNVPWDGNVWGLVTPAAYAQMETIDDFVSIDYNNIKPLVEGAPPPGQFREWLGVKWVRHTGLTGFGGATAKCYMYHELAMGHQADGEPHTHLYYDDKEDKYGTWVRQRHVAKRILDEGVYRAVHNDTATIA